MAGLRICYIIPDFDETGYAGGLYTVFQHCNGLAKLGHEVRAFNNIGKKSRYHGLDVELLRHHNDPKEIEKFKPQIVTISQWRNFYLMMRFTDVVRNNTKLVYSVQGIARQLCRPEEVPYVTKTYVGKYRDIIPVLKITNARYLKEYLAGEFGEESTYIKSGFEHRDVSPILEKGSKVRIIARYDTSHYRGWESVNEVLASVSRERQDIEIHLFEMKPKSATSYPSVYHEGLHGDKLLGLLKSCDIFLGGTMQEAFSRPALEAMSQGCAVCTLHPEGPGEFCVDGETALLAKPGDTEGLYRNLSRLIDNPALRKRLRARGVEKTKEFTWQGCINELGSFYMRISGESYRDITASPRSVSVPGTDMTGSTLIIWDKDPLSSYVSELIWHEAVAALEQRVKKAEIMTLVSTRPIGFIKPHLEATMSEKNALTCRFRVFYIKSLRLRMGLFGRICVTAESAVKTLSGSYSEVICRGKAPFAITLAAAARKVRVRSLGMDDPALNRYSFGDYTKAFEAKEKEFKALVRKIISQAS